MEAPLESQNVAEETTDLFDEFCADRSDVESEHGESGPVYLENNEILWFPPEPENEEDEREVFDFNDDDDDGDATGEWGYLRNSSRFGSGEYQSRDKPNEERKKALKNVLDGHIRASMAQLLQVENLLTVEENDKDQNWLEIITALSWEAATLLKPDMSKGGQMDPGGYVKVKCLASGLRSESMVVKGVVCNKNVAHQRMSSKIEKARVLLLGGALEGPGFFNALSSFDTPSQQEIDHLKMVVAKIDAHNPDILLVEKSVSRYAQEYLLAKDISLVLNIKRPLLERIARCTGGQIVSSIDHLSSQKSGYCDMFHVERFPEEHRTTGEAGKKLVKILMYFEGCPNPVGCTILLRGANEDELKKVKHIVHYGVLAAYRLDLETSFLADEGASPITVAFPDMASTIDSEKTPGPQSVGELQRSNSDCSDVDANKNVSNPSLFQTALKEEFSPSPSDHESIRVSLSSRCVWKGVVCERSHLFQIEYYGSFDMPVGRYLQDQLFDQNHICRSCDMPAEAHVRCYTHGQGSLTVSVKKFQEFLLPGKSDGKIWMWHRCLKCPRTNGFPPATRRVVMSDAAWQLSFGKFLELSFSNHVAASRVASCGHSLLRDCLRFYGFGGMVACFRYESIDVYSVYLPPSKLDFNYESQEWIEREVNEVAGRAELLFSEVLNALRLLSSSINIPESRHQIEDLEGMLQNEKLKFEESLEKISNKVVKKGQPVIDILELNRLCRQLVFHSHTWDHRLINATNNLDINKKLHDENNPGIGIPRNNIFSESVQDDKLSTAELFIKSGLLGGPRLLLPVGVNDTVVPVYDDEPTSIISYALLSPDFFAQMCAEPERPKDNADSTFSIKSTDAGTFQSFHSVDEMTLEISFASSPSSSLPLDPLSLHARVSFADDGPLGKVEYIVTCYYANRFEALRRICCPSEMDFIRSLSRCEKRGSKVARAMRFLQKL